MAIARARHTKFVKAFTQSDWINNTIEVIRAGVPTTGQLGPHLLPSTYFFNTDVYKQKNSGAFLKEVGVHIAQHLDGKVVIRKAPLAPAFDGVISIHADQYE